MDRQSQTATSFVVNRLITAAAVLGGMVLVGRGVLEWSAGRMPADLGAVSIGAGGALLLAASNATHVHRLRVRSAELFEALNDLLYGKDHRREREAVTILIRSLESPDSTVRATAHAHLRRLTGLDLAADPAVWKAWWSANERHWSRTAGPSGAGTADPAQ